MQPTRLIAYPDCARLVLLHHDGSKPKPQHGPTRHPQATGQGLWNFDAS